MSDVSQPKKCPDCGAVHTGMFELCYPCFDKEEEVSYDPT